MPKNYDQFTLQLQDFPRSEIWRLQTDGWQHIHGPKNFRDAYYKGMNEAYEFIKTYLDTPISKILLLDLRNKAAQFEPYYDKNDLVSGSDFLIFLATPDMKSYPMAHLSDTSIPEFVEALKKAHYDNTWSLGIPPYKSLREKSKDKGYFIYPDKFKSDQELIDYLKLALAADGKSFEAYLTKKPLPEGEEDAHCKIISCRDPITLANLLDVGTKAFNNKIDNIKKSDISDQDDKIIAEIVKLARHFHQNHPFKDENGRTFMLLMMNMLLLQNNLSFCIVETPSHFTGFDVEQLIQEVKNGQQVFQEYLITKAKNVLNHLTTNDFKDMTKIKNALKNNLSTKPIIALAQINELYIRIKANELKVPQNYWGDEYDTGCYNFFSKNFHTQYIAHTSMLNLLQNLYLKKLKLVFQDKSTKPAEGFTMKGKSYSDEDVFKSMLEKHGILNDKMSDGKALNIQVDTIISAYYAQNVSEQTSPINYGAIVY